MAEGFYYDVLTHPQWSEADGRAYSYRLKEDWTESTGITGLFVVFPTDDPMVLLGPDGRLTLKAGYLWDGPSGLAVDTANFMRASAVHDALYQLERKWGIQIRAESDAEMLRIAREDGMGWFRRYYCWLTVRIVGGIWNSF